MLEEVSSLPYIPSGWLYRLAGLLPAWQLYDIAEMTASYPQSSSTCHPRDVQHRRDGPGFFVSMQAPGQLILQWTLSTFISMTFSNVSPPHHLNHFPVSSLGNGIPSPGSAVSPILEDSRVCCQTELEGSVCHEKGSWFILVHFLRMSHSFKS